MQQQNLFQARVPFKQQVVNRTPQQHPAKHIQTVFYTFKKAFFMPRKNQRQQCLANHNNGTTNKQQQEISFFKFAKSFQLNCFLHGKMPVNSKHERLGILPVDGTRAIEFVKDSRVTFGTVNSIQNILFKFLVQLFFIQR